MVCPKGSCVFPLRIRDSITFSDRDPAIFASGRSWALVRLLKPRDNTRCFRAVASMCFVIVRERAIKWVLSRCKSYRDIIAPIARIRVVETAVVFCPLFVPRTCAIWDKIVSAWLFADPKDCGYDLSFPRILARRPRGGSFSDEGFVFVSDGFDLSSKGWIKCGKQRETKKPKRAAFPHYFPIASRSNTA